MKHPHFIRSVFLMMMLATSCCVFSQTSFYKEKNYFSLSAGYMFNHPILSHNTYNIKRAVSFDHRQSAAWYHFVSGKAGWMLQFAHSTQSLRYRHESADSLKYRNVHEHFHKGTPDDRYSLTFGACYNFMAARRLNFLLTGGPLLLLSGTAPPEDSIAPHFKSEHIEFNTRRMGIGVYLGLHLVYKINTRFCAFLLPSYQRGFIKVREARIGMPQRYSVLSYYGSGGGVSAGLLFYLKKKEAREVSSD